MVVEMMKNWEVAVDGIQIFLCLLILFFLVRNHRRKLKPELTHSKPVSGQDFNSEVFSQTIHQQMELAFTNIQNVVAGEHRDLGKILRLQQVKLYDHSPSETLPPSQPAQDKGVFKNTTESADQAALRKRIREMDTRGMTPKQIADALKTPLGEIELILSLQKNA